MGAEKLLKDIENQFNKWDERSQFKMCGVGNLSVSDLETLEYYAEEYLNRGTIDHLSKPLGGLDKILESYGIQHKGW